MKEDRDCVERLLAGLAPPEVPADLAARVLPLARAALAKPLPPDRWALVWTNPGLRLAWATAVVVLVLCNALFPSGREKVKGPGALPLTLSVREGGEELAAVGFLPRIDPDARSLGELWPASKTETKKPGRSMPSAIPPKESKT